MASFGHHLVEEFIFDRDHVFMNHGSYGSVAARVHQEHIRLLNLCEHNPDQWFRRLVPTMLQENLEAIAQFLKSDVQNLVFVPNATTGANCVVKSLPFEPGEAIMAYSYTYQAVKNACAAAMEKSGGEVLTMTLDLEIPSVQFVLDKYREFIEAHPNIKLVVLDYISSSTAIKFPVKELVQLCKQHNKLVLVDAAHTPGQLEIDLEEMGRWGMDFYTGNIHKWMYAPRGCAVLWTHPKHHAIIKPVVTAHNYNAGTILQDFTTQGTKDDTPYYSVVKAIEVYESLGGLSKIPAYAGSLLDQAGEMLSKAWGTQTFPMPKDMQSPFMRLVLLPELKKYPIEGTTTSVFSDINALMYTLYSRFKITVVVLGIWGKPCVRMAANVYNEMSDYEALRDAILTLVQEDSS